MNIRKTVLSLLEKYEEEAGFANLLLRADLLAEAGEEAPFLTALFYGTVERMLTLSYAACQLSGRGKDALAPHTRRLLAMGLYQIYYMQLPAYAAVNETVSLGKTPGERALLNAVFRRALQEKTPPLPPKEKVARYLSVRESVPQETVKRFLSLFGRENTEALLTFYNRVSPLTLCLNPLKTSRPAYLALLKEQGWDASPSPFAPMGVKVFSSVSPTVLPGYGEGWFFVQDEASQLQTLALAPETGDRIIDVCACPGGKSFGALCHTGGGCEVYAFDIHKSKLPLIEKGAKRLGFSLSVAAVDATVGKEDLFGKAERVICDVPCSGLGVLGKKPDLRYRPISADLPALQYRILETAARYLAPGGVLVYSTCTLLPEENEGNVRRFLSENPAYVPEEFGQGPVQSREGMLTLLPFVHGTDGFFIAKLRKRKMIV